MARTLNRIACLALLCSLLGANAFLTQNWAKASVAEPAGARLDLTSYIAELERWSRAVANLDQHATDAARLRLSLPPKWSVEARGETFDVSTGWLDRALLAVEKDTTKAKSAAAEIRKRLLEMRQAAMQFSAPASTPPIAQARADVEKIFRRREFRAMHGPSWFDLLRERIAYWISRILEKIFGRLHPGRITDVLAWGLILFALLALLWLIRSNLTRISRGTQFTLPAGSAGNDAPNWTRAAMAAAGRGDYREAIHCAYWAAVAQLESSGILPRDRSRTPRESLRLLPAGNIYRVALTNLTECLERVWYGFRPATATEWSDVTAELEKLGCPLRSMPLTAGS